MLKHRKSQEVALSAESIPSIARGYFSTVSYLTAYAAMIRFKVQLRVFLLYSTLETAYNILTR